MAIDTINIGGKEFSLAEMQVLSKAGLLNFGQKNDPAATTLTGGALHGPVQGSTTQFGAFTSPGVRPERFSALVRPNSFLPNVTLERSNYTNDILEILTGQSGATGTNATGFCGNPPTVGWLKTCQQTYTWGDYYIKTHLNAAALIGQQKNRADVPARILNAGPQPNSLFPDFMYSLDDTMSQFRHEMFKVGVDAERNTELVAVQGVAGTQNSTYLGWFTQFKGLDGLIKTGHTDSSGYTCQAVDSAVVSFNAAITGNDALGRSVIEAYSDTMRGLWKRADSVGMGRGNVEWAFVMRSELYAALVDIWACSYGTYRCAGTSTSPNNRDADMIQNRRVEMMAGQYLLIDNIQVPVIFSEGIPLDVLGNNYYKSDAYIVPFSWQGMPLLKMEYFPMDNQYTTEYMNNFGITTVDTANNGLWLIGKRDTGLCLEWHLQARMRLILETPFLAGRIDDGFFNFYEPIRQAIPGSSLYANGGVSYRS